MGDNQEHPTYHFQCSECEKLSEHLGNQYTRLRPGTFWVCEKCTKKLVKKAEVEVVVESLVDGSICRLTDF